MPSAVQAFYPVSLERNSLDLSYLLTCLGLGFDFYFTASMFYALFGLITCLVIAMNHFREVERVVSGKRGFGEKLGMFNLVSGLLMALWLSFWLYVFTSLSSIVIDTSFLAVLRNCIIGIASAVGYNLVFGPIYGKFL